MATVLVSGPVNGIVTLTLNRAEKRNALSTAMREEIVSVLGRIAAGDAAKVVVVTGAGEVFSAGFDLKEMQGVAAGDLDGEAFWKSSDMWHRAWLEFPLPTIAALNGPALAGGFDLAVMCDLRIAAESVRLAHPEHSFSDVVYAPLLDLVGSAIAKDLVLTGRAVEADEALRLHLVSAVVPRDVLLEEALRYASMIAEAPRDVLVRAKEKANRRAATVVDGRLDV